MRVLVIAKDFPSPGQSHAGIFVLRQVRALADLGHEIRVVRVVPYAPPWTPKWRAYRAIPQSCVVDGIPVQTIRAFFPPRMVAMEYLPLQVSTALRRIASEFAPQIVHGQFLIPSGQLAVRAGLPAVVTAHGSDAYDWAWRRAGLRKAATEAVRCARVAVAVSEFIADRVRALSERDVQVVYNGADEDVFAPSDRLKARAALDLESDRYVIAFAGWPTRAKGAFDLIDAVARLGDVNPLLLFAGNAPQEPDLTRALAGRGVEARLLGRLEHRELARVLAAADVFALPSYREGLPAAICEAMLAGRPVVSTRVGGIPEIVTDGVTGFLIEPGNVPLLAERLRTIAREPVLAGGMGAAGYAFARGKLTWRVNALQYEELYRRALVAAA